MNIKFNEEEEKLSSIVVEVTKRIEDIFSGDYFRSETFKNTILEIQKRKLEK